MRRYDDPVEVRKGADEEPEQFLWRGRLWLVRAVVAHWVETGPWWQAPGVRAVVGSAVHESSEQAVAKAGIGAGAGGSVATLEPDLLTHDLLREREVWRVEASRGRAVGAVDDPGFGVFDLVFDWAAGAWRLSASVD